jgi:hypothetical protein
MSKSHPKLKIIAGLFCDDVRTERSGKLIVIGAYGQNITVPSFPATLVLNCLVIAEAQEAGEVDIEFRLSIGNATVTTGKGRAKFARGRALLPVQNLLLANVAGAGEITLELKQDSGRWTTVSSIPFEQMEN